METEGKAACVYLNASGLSEHSQLKVEILTREFDPVPGFSGDDCIAVTESGFRQRVGWAQRDSLAALDGPVRVKVIWGGIRPEDACLHAAYVG